MDASTFFDSWGGLGRVVIVGTVAYASLILILRLSGKRTLSKMNAFDLVVTVALGSTLATIILSKDVALTEGVVALALLIGLQYVVSWSSVRSPLIGQLVKSEPTLLFFQGEFLQEQLRQSRVVEDEVLAAVRQQGIASLNEVTAVILETDGSMAVVQAGGDDRTALNPVPRVAKETDARTDRPPTR